MQMQATEMLAVPLVRAQPKAGPHRLPVPLQHPHLNRLLLPLPGRLRLRPPALLPPRHQRLLRRQRLPQHQRPHPLQPHLRQVHSGFAFTYHRRTPPTKREACGSMARTLRSIKHSLSPAISLPPAITASMSNLRTFRRQPAIHSYTSATTDSSQRLSKMPHLTP